MRRLISLLVLLAFRLPAFAADPACTGLCLKQVACTGGATTTISGTVFAPNGVDPLPDVLVFIPNAAVAAMPVGVSCPVPGAAPSGSPLVGTTTAADGTFVISNVPVGTDIPLVIQAGSWRRQLVVPATTACANTAFNARMPRNQSEGDIPHIAVATGSSDEVECVLRKVGLDDAEFTNPLGTGRIHLYAGSGSPGAVIDANTPSQNTLMSSLPTLNNYDVLMLPCQGRAYTQTATALSNIIQYANGGGRVYSSHFSYVWMYQNPPFDKVANWHVNQPALPDGVAAVDPSFYGGQTLTTWLQTVGASTTPGQIAIQAVKHDTDGVIAPTQSWLNISESGLTNVVQQFTFNTPIGSANQCGRVLFNEYHVENPSSSPTGKSFPSECSTGAMTSQEKLLEYSLFDLTGSGGQPTMAPAAADFGSEPVGFQTATKTFAWTNNSIFATSVTSITATGDFVVVANNCQNVAQGASCAIQVAYHPTALGPATGTLSVVAPAATLTANLTGTGVPALTSSTSALAFSNVDVGAKQTQSLVLQNSASGPVAPAYTLTGDFTATGNCGATLAAGANCVLQITFQPSSTGAKPGTLTFNGGTVNLTGTGVDFTAAANPSSGSTIAGIGVTVPLAVLPVSGFSNAVNLSCTTSAPGSTCTLTANTLVPSTTAADAIVITTVPKYAVVGYGGFGKGWLTWMALASGVGLWVVRKRIPAAALRSGVALLVLTLCGAGLAGCSGKEPAANAVYTAPGDYTYTVTATDGFLTHSTTYTLHVTAN